MTSLPMKRSPPRRRRADREPNPGWVVVIAILLSVAALDWLSKFLVYATVPEGQMVEVLSGRLALWHVRNPEMVLGLWGSLPLEGRQLIALGAVVLTPLLLFGIIARTHRFPPRHRPAAWWFAGLMAGGMLGNLGERALHWSVTDFLSIGMGGLWLPPGNVADLALLAAMPLMVPVVAAELAGRAQRQGVSAGAYMRQEVETGSRRPVRG